MIAHEEAPNVLEWIFNAAEHGGGFLSNFARAAMVADHDNYPRIRPIVEYLRLKYPAYDPSSPQFAKLPSKRHDFWMNAEQWRYAAWIVRNELKQPIARRNGAPPLPDGLEEFLAALFDYAEHKRKE